MEYYIIEDEEGESRSLRNYMNDAFPGSQFLGSHRPLKNWDAAVQSVLSESPEDKPFVLFVDVTLAAGRNAYLVAKEAIQNRVPILREVRPRAVIIMYSQFADDYRGNPLFHGFISKLRVSDDRGSHDRVVEYVRDIVEGAMSGRGLDASGVPLPEFCLEDSLGLRLAQAAFGPNFFLSLIRKVAKGWNDVRIRALTSGHSGAYVLQVEGSRSGNQASLVIKCARSADIIRGDVRVFESDRLATLGVLGNHLAPADKSIDELRDIGCYFYQQASVKGQPLLAFLGAAHSETAMLSVMARVVGLELEQCGSMSGFASVEPRLQFELAKIDRERAQASLGFLGKCACTLLERGDWPTSKPEPGPLLEQIRHLLVNWDRTMASQAQLYGVIQHGDLNPGNIMVTPTGFVLIDFSRLGSWPVGYDLCRLATMLRLRLTDAQGHSDWVVNGLMKWCLEPFCDLMATRNGPTICECASFCDREFAEFARKQPEKETELRRGYLIGTLFDLVKVLSYTDLSVYKRLWALVACYELKTELGM